MTIDDNSDHIRALYDSSQARWGQVDWPFAAYETHIRIVSGADNAYACDLYLSGAAGLRVENAWVMLENWIKPLTLRVISSYRLRGCDPEDIWGDVIVRLSKQDPTFPTSEFRSIGFSETPAAVARFDGRCKLENYVLLIAKRLAFDEIKRHQTRLNGFTHLKHSTECSTQPETNENALLNDPEAARTLSKNLSNTFASFSAEDRALCAMVYSGRMTRRQASSFLGWSDPSKATRRLQRIGELLTRTLEGVCQDGVGALSPDQADNVLGLLLRHMQFQPDAPSLKGESQSAIVGSTSPQEHAHESNR